MTTEAVEPDIKEQEVPATPPPERPSPFQRIMDKFQGELGRLSGQLLVERAEREMEREALVEQIEALQKALEDAGVVPKSAGDEPPAAPGDAAPVTPIRPPAKKATKATHKKKRKS